LRRGSPLALGLLAAFAGWSVAAAELAGRQLQAIAVLTGLVAYLALEVWRAHKRRLPLWTAFRPPVWFDPVAYLGLIAAPIFAKSVGHFAVGWLGPVFAGELAFLELVGRRRTR
jgi:hypothetical protein